MEAKSIFENFKEDVYNMCHAVSELKEYSDPIKHRAIFKEILTKNNTKLEDLFEMDLSTCIDLETRKQFDSYLRDYNELKGMQLVMYESGNIDNNSPFMSMDLNSVFRMNDVLEKTMGGFLTGYHWFVSYGLSKEYLDSYYSKDLSEAEKLDDIGNELNEQQRYDEALPFFEKSLKLSPDFSLAYINKGIALKNLDRENEAIACYDKVINDIDPRYKKAWYNKAVALEKIGETEKAKECLNQALSIDPSYPHAVSFKLRLECGLGNGPMIFFL